MAYSTRFAALLVTLQCPLECDHCVYECSPYVTDRMSLDQMRRYIDQLAGIGVQLVLFSGGEPFLLGRDLDAIVEHTTRMGMDLQIITACHWATSIERTRERLQRLADRGLKYLIVSCDDYHQEFVPFANVRNTIEVAVELGLSFNINVVYTSQSRITKRFLDEEFRDLLERNQRYVEGKRWVQMLREIGAQRQSPTFVNLVSKLSPREKSELNQYRVYEIHPEPACERSGRCTLENGETVPDFALGHKTLNQCNALFSLLIRPDGSVKGCIGHIHAQTEPELHLGNLESDNLVSILDQAHTNPMLRCLEWGGPGVIAQYLLEQEPSLQLKDRYRLGCDLCSDLFANPDLRPVMERHIQGLYERLKDNHREQKHSFMIDGRRDSPAAATVR